MTDTTTVRVGGVPVVVRRSGSGPDLLFVHGVYVNGSVWDEVVALLEADHTCWVPTLPLGAHEAPLQPDWRPDLAALADLVPGLLDALDLTEVTVVGNDSGGGLVLVSLGSGAPGLSRIARLVLTNCDSYEHLPPKSFKPVIALCRRAPLLGRGLLRLLLCTRPGQRLFLAGVTTTAGRRPQLFGSPAVLRDAVRVTAALAATPEQQRMAWLPDLTVPTTLVWGDADRFFPRADGERLAATLPRATITWVAGAKTFVQLDDPGAVADAVRASGR